MEAGNREFIVLKLIKAKVLSSSSHSTNVLSVNGNNVLKLSKSLTGASTVTGHTITGKPHLNWRESFESAESRAALDILLSGGVYTTG